MKKNCLNCKWEPEWISCGAGSYKRRVGFCRFPFERPRNLPQCFVMTRPCVEVYEGGSGMIDDCVGWEAKDDFQHK